MSLKDAFRIVPCFALPQSCPLFVYRGVYTPLLYSYRGGSLSHKTTPVQAHRGFRLLTLASYNVNIRKGQGGAKFMRKREFFKRITAWALSLAMMLGLLPFNMMGSVWAASDATSEVTESIEASERKIKINDDWLSHPLSHRSLFWYSEDRTANHH